MKRVSAIAILVLLLDQASKCAIKSTLSLGQSIPLIPRLLHLTYVRNTGAAFGILAGKRVFFILASLVVAVVLVIQAREARGKPWLQFAIGLMLGGAAGNLADRLCHPWVIDFIDVKFFPPTFNLADSALVVGVVLFALDTLLAGRSKSGEI